MKAKVKAMGTSNTDLQWAQHAVATMLRRVCIGLASEYETAAKRLRAWVR